MTAAQRKKLDRLFVAIGRCEGKMQSLRNQIVRTDGPTKGAAARDAMIEAENLLNQAWNVFIKAGLIR